MSHMIIDFSSLGSGDGKHTDLCGECNYTITIRRKGRAPQPAWLTGTQIQEQYGNQQVKVVVRAINRCHAHSDRGKAMEKGRPAFLEAALMSGVDIYDGVDEYRAKLREIKK